MERRRHPHDSFGPPESTKGKETIDVCLLLRLDSAVLTSKYGYMAPSNNHKSLSLTLDTLLYHFWESSELVHKWTLSIIQFTGDYRLQKIDDVQTVIEW